MLAPRSTADDVLSGDALGRAGCEDAPESPEAVLSALAAGVCTSTSFDGAIAGMPLAAAARVGTDTPPRGLEPEGWAGCEGLAAVGPALRGGCALEDKPMARATAWADAVMDGSALRADAPCDAPTPTCGDFDCDGTET